MIGLISIGLVLWFVVAIWPAYLAKKKGYSFVLFLLASWVVSWVVTLVVVLLLQDKTKPVTEPVA